MIYDTDFQLCLLAGMIDETTELFMIYDANSQLCSLAGMVEDTGVGSKRACQWDNELFTCLK